MCVSFRGEVRFPMHYYMILALVLLSPSTYQVGVSFFYFLFGGPWGYKYFLSLLDPVCPTVLRVVRSYQDHAS